MQALILAGGKGSRLLPYTKVIPKPLMPIGEMPILEIILRQLKNSGFDNVILAVNYLSQMFELFFQKGEKTLLLTVINKNNNESKVLKIRGAGENNLKNINIDIPKNKFVVFTGVSGSGKSSLAFDTIYAEGQRRYVESLSAYARQFFRVNAKT